MYEHEIAVGAAKAAGEVLKEKFGKVRHIVKKGEIDLGKINRCDPYFFTILTQ